MSKSPCKICVVTGTRAEYGLLRWVIQSINDSELLDLQLIVTGMHLSPEFGLTVKEIEADGFHIDRKVEILLSSDTAVGVTKSMGLAMICFSDALSELNPDLLLVLGDRYEIFAAVSAGLIACIPIAHCHGGELTEGAFDDALRHSITKMSTYHFVATHEYRQRVIQMGEHPDRVFVVGGLGVDAIKQIKLLSREELEASIDFSLGKNNLLITFHPVTLEQNKSAHQMKELLAALDKLDETNLIFTMPNADTGGRELIKMVEEFCATRPFAISVISLGQQRYFSCIEHCDGVVGNSSSGLLEVPSFNKPTVNIGNRQKGRVQARSIINCQPIQGDITSALKKLFDLKNLNNPSYYSNPYGNGEASKNVVSKLEQLSPALAQSKQFFDISYPASKY